MALENASAICIGLMMMVVAVYYFFSKKPVSIYNQEQPPQACELTNVQLYNRATALLLFVYGVVFIGEGILINNPLFCLVIVVLTVMPGIVIVISIYEMAILKKFMKK